MYSAGNTGNISRMRYEVRKFSTRPVWTRTLFRGSWLFWAVIDENKPGYACDLTIDVTGRPDYSGVGRVECGKPYILPMFIDVETAMTVVIRARRHVFHATPITVCITPLSLAPGQVCWDDIHSVPIMDHYLTQGWDVNAYVRNACLGPITLYCSGETETRSRDAKIHQLLNLEPSRGVTLLHCAAFFDNPAAILFLLGRGASKQVITQDSRRTPLELALATNASPRTIELLLNDDNGDGINLASILASLPGIPNIGANITMNNSGSRTGATFPRVIVNTSGNNANPTTTTIFGNITITSDDGTVRFSNIGGTSSAAHSSGSASVSYSSGTASAAASSGVIIPHQRYRCVTAVTGRDAIELTVRQGEEVIALEAPDSVGWVRCRKCSNRNEVGFLPVWNLAAVASVVNERRKSKQKPQQKRQSDPAPSAPPLRSISNHQEGVRENVPCRVLYGFQATGRGELTVKANEIVTPLEQPGSDGWTKVKVSRPSGGLENQRLIGYVPSSFLGPFTEPRSAPAQSVHASMAEEARESPESEEQFECPICYVELPSSSVAVFISNALQMRTCRHFLHMQCASEMMKLPRKVCPVCRAPFDSVRQLPDFETDPRGWFDVLDMDNNGGLCKSEVVDCLKATLPVDATRLEAEVDALWGEWTENCGSITYDQAIRPTNSLLAFTRRKLAVDRMRQGPSRYPKLTAENAHEWFRFYDLLSRGSLSLSEVREAILKSFGIPSDQRERVEVVELVLEDLWISIVGSLEARCTEKVFCEKISGTLAIVLNEFEREAAFERQASSHSNAGLAGRDLLHEVFGGA